VHSVEASRYIFVAGEMAELTRAFDWSQTTVGSFEKWPNALLVTVNTLLASPHPMFLWWGRDLLQFYNDGYRRLLRDDKHPLALGQKGPDCWPEIWSIICPQIEQVMTTGLSIWKEDQLIPINRGGKLEDVYWTYAYSAVRDLCGQICGTLVTCTETTRQQLEEQALRQDFKRLADLFEQAPAFFALLRGPQHIFEMINSPYQQLLGPRSVIGQSVRAAMPEVEDQGFISLLDNVYRTGEPFIGRSTPIKLARHGSEVLEERTLDFVYQPMRDAKGEISGVIILGVDVTEGKRAEQVILQTEKLAAVGRLATSIAHEINNPLESVTNLIYLAQQSTVYADTKAYLETAEIELRRVSAITNQTLRFHRQSTRPRPAIAEDLFDSTLSIYRGRLLNTQVELSRRDRAVRPALCFDGEIRQVLSNLVGNAIDAMSGGGGRLLVRTREGTNWKTGEKGLCFTVADTGAGMSRDISAKIFVPFFTTKGFSGTGLGLWVSQEIVKRHRGKLALRSSQRKNRSGTVFVFFLPFDAAISTSEPSHL
jgi:signal transduction histidine kinase